VSVSLSILPSSATIIDCCTVVYTVIKYKLFQALVGVPDLDDHPKIVTLPAGTEIELLTKPPQTGLVDVLCKGQHIAVFMQDLVARAEAARMSHA